jgi:hypothetical protein
MFRYFTMVLVLIQMVSCGSAPNVPPQVSRSQDETSIIKKPEPDLERELARLGDPSQHAGSPATVWDMEKPFRVLPMGSPLPQGGAVSLWMHLAGPVEGVNVAVRVRAQGKTLGGTMGLAGQGWRRVLFPVRALEPVSETLPADCALSLQIMGKVPAGVTVSIADVRCEKNAQGPSLSETDLLAQIDWSVPGLATARDRLAMGDHDGALRGLAAYVRQRPVHWKLPELDASTEKTVANADRLLRGEVDSIGLKHSFDNGQIDWLANPTLGTPRASSEWVWSLNRHNLWTGVATSYRLTHKAEYVTGWVRLMRSWVEQAPAPAVADEKAGSVWRDLEAGLRVTNAWFHGFYSVIDSPDVTDQDIILFLSSLWDHAHHLSVADFNPTNHFIFGMTGLYTVGSEFPEFREAKTWRTIAMRNLERSLTGSTLDEGCWYELAPGYGMWVCNKLIDMWNNAEASGQTAELSPLLRGKLQRMAEWGLHLMSPERAVPMLNDGGALTYNVDILAELSKRFPESEVLRSAADLLAGKPGATMPWTSEALPDSGYTVMRTGWGRKDSYVLLDVGPLGGWHGHQDALNLVAYFHGRFFLFDNGGFKYDSSDWRKYGPTTAAHNTVLVDGMGQLRSWNGEVDAIGRNPLDMPKAQFASSEVADYASGWYVSGYGKKVADRGKVSSANQPSPASHRREVVFLKPVAGHERGPLTVVLDTLAPIDAAAHRYELRWHLKTTKWKTDQSQRVTWTTDAGQPNLIIIALSGADDFHADSGVLKPELLGWWFSGQNADPTPALTLRQARKATGKVQLLTALIPFTGDPAANPVLGIDAAGDKGWTIRVRDQPPITVRLSEAGNGPGINVDGVVLPLAKP